MDRFCSALFFISIFAILAAFQLASGQGDSLADVETKPRPEWRNSWRDSGRVRDGKGGVRIRQPHTRPDSPPVASEPEKREADSEEQGFNADPLSSDSNPDGSLEDLLELVEDTAGFQADPVEFQADPVGFQADPAGFQADPVGFQADPAEFQADPAGFQADPAGFQADPAGFSADQAVFGDSIEEFQSRELAEDETDLVCPERMSITPAIVTVGDTVTCSSNSHQSQTSYSWKNLQTGEVSQGQTFEVTGQDEQGYSCTATVTVDGVVKCSHTAIVDIHNADKSVQSFAAAAPGETLPLLLETRVLTGLASASDVLEIDCKHAKADWKLRRPGFKNRPPTAITSDCKVTPGLEKLFEVDASTGGCNLVVKDLSRNRGLLKGNYTCEQKNTLFDHCSVSAYLSPVPSSDEAGVPVRGGSCWRVCLSGKGDEKVFKECRRNCRKKTTDTITDL